MFQQDLLLDSLLHPHLNLRHSLRERLDAPLRQHCVGEPVAVLLLMLLMLLMLYQRLLRQRALHRLRRLLLLLRLLC